MTPPVVDVVVELVDAVAVEDDFVEAFVVVAFVEAVVAEEAAISLLVPYPNILSIFFYAPRALPMLKAESARVVNCILTI